MNYYIKLQDTYLQTDDRDRPFFSDSNIGTPYKVSDEHYAEHLLSVLFSGIPFNMFTLELIETKTIYYRYARVGADYIVYCNDARWHNERDLPLIKAKPIKYETPDKASQAGNLGSLKVFAYVGQQ